MRKTRLILCLRGIRNTAGHDVPDGPDVGGRFPQAFRDFLADAFPQAHVLYPKIDAKMGVASTAHPCALADQIIAEILAASKDHGPFEEIDIIGFSAGSVLAREVLLRANGVQEDGAVDPGAAQPFRHQIRRMILLSSIVRGVQVSSVTPLRHRLVWPLVRSYLYWAKRVPFRPVEHLMGHMQRHAPYVLNARLRQIALETRFDAQRGTEAPDVHLPLMISAIGTRDELVSPGDAIELSAHPNYAFLEMPKTGHRDAVQVDTNTDPSAQMRRDLITAALRAEGPDALTDNQHYIKPDDVNDYFDELDRPARDLTGAVTSGAAQIKHAVIVLHGIRDHGFWTKRIAKTIKSKEISQGAEVRTFLRAPSPGYGFFSIQDFVRPWRREAQARWLMAQYADIRACYRDAQISFVGHSNGTYLAARMLELGKAVRLHQVYFAGSVVRRGYRWARHHTPHSKVAGAQPQHTGRLVNMAHRGDSVVALLPGGLERLGLGRVFDVGGAGFGGFTEASDTLDARGAKLTNRYRDGTHQTGVQEGAWDEIAEFIVNDRVPKPGRDGAGWQRAHYRAAALVPLGIVLCAVLVVAMFLGFGVLVGCALAWLTGHKAGFALGLGLGWALIGVAAIARGAREV